MGWNGNGTFSRLYSWVQDAANGLKISSTRMDADTNDIVTAGLGNCITRDNQGQATAQIDFPFGMTATKAAASAAQLRSGASGSFAEMTIGRTADEAQLGVAALVHDFFTVWSATAGDVVLKDTSGAIWLYAGTDINAIIPNSPKLFRVGNASGAALISLSGDGASLAFPAISTTASAANAYLDNSASPANNLLRSTSSGVYKANVQTLALEALAGNDVSIGQGIGGKPEQVSVVDNLTAVTYTSLAAADDPNRQFVGMIAEDVAAIMPALVTYTKMRSLSKTDPRYDANADPETDLPESVQYERLSVILLAEVQSLRSRLAALEAK